MRKFSICCAVFLVGACAAATSFAAGDAGALNTNNVLIVAAEGGIGSVSADLDYLVRTINKGQSKKMKSFEGKSKRYFEKAQTPETIENVIGQLPPGDAVTALVLSNLSKKPVREIIDMKTSGTSWQDIAEQTGVKLKNVVSEVKEFRFGIG